MSVERVAVSPPREQQQHAVDAADKSAPFSRADATFTENRREEEV